MIPFNMGLNTGKAVEQETVTEAFEGYVECPLFAQECRIVLETDGLVFEGRFQQVDVMYGEITAIHLTDYLLTLTTDSGKFTISRMGQKLQWLYEKLYAAYNDAVLEALKITGIPKRGIVFYLKSEVNFDFVLELFLKRNDRSYVLG